MTMYLFYELGCYDSVESSRNQDMNLFVPYLNPKNANIGENCQKCVRMRTFACCCWVRCHPQMDRDLFLIHGPPHLDRDIFKSQSLFLPTQP
jgi:hypothetical protein